MASGSTILLEIVTPHGVALREEVNEVTAPSVAGEFGVLPGHLPVLAALRTGMVTYHKGSTEHRFVVAPGFVEVANDKALLLTDRFAGKDDVDVVKVRMRLKEVEDELGSYSGDLRDPHRAELIEEEQWLAAQLELIGDAPLPIVREDTRFFALEAEPITPEEAADAHQSDESLTHRHD
jgi:F-type H+-transporting ATPase subunit epsilon